VSFLELCRRFLVYNTLTLLPALLLGVPLVKGAQAVGLFTKPLNRRRARACLGRCATVFAQRGTAPGWAHLLETIELRRRGKQSVVGICPSSLLAVKDPRGCPALMASLVTRLVSSGDLVVLFPNATRGRSDAGPRNNDLHVISRVLDALHAMVALSLGKPTVVVGWSHKYLEVMEESGLGRHVLDEASATLPRVMASVDELRSDLPAYRARVEREPEGVRRRALEQIEFIADKLRS